MGIEPMPSAWKAEVLPLNYTRRWLTSTCFVPNLVPSDPSAIHLELPCFNDGPSPFLVEGVGFEPTKA
jgi:hypothetical protein